MRKTSSSTLFHKTPGQTLLLVMLLADASGTWRPAMKLVAGNANKELAEEISARLGVPLTPATIDRYVDGEVTCRRML